MKNCIFYFNFDRKVKYERKSKHGIIKLRRLIPVFHSIVQYPEIMYCWNAYTNVRTILEEM